MADHRLLNQLTAANVSDEEIEELYNDLRYVFENPFDEQINAAIARNCAYVEQVQPVSH